MLKLIDIDQSFFFEEPVITIIDPGASKGMVKSAAADSRITKFAAEIKPDPGKIYVHILAMGAGEYFGANRNADYFPEENLIKYHQTFSSSPAHIFKHHINKNPAIAIGQVVFSIYNERMHRVEIIAWIDKEKGYDVVEKIERGELPATSMACHTPYDTCSICGNQARSRQEYCVHLKNELGKLSPSGVKTMAINDGPLKFFDMSIVFRPADVTSSVMQKVASEVSYSTPVLGSAEAATLAGLQEKTAQLRKLSELIKEVEGVVDSSSPTLHGILSKTKDPSDDILGLLAQYDMHHVLHALSELGISPSIGYFAKLIGQKITGGEVAGIEGLVSGLIQEDAESLPVPEMTLEKASHYDLKPSLLSVLTPFIKQASLFPDPVIQRAADSDRDISGIKELFPHAYEPGVVVESGNMGYIGGGPAVSPDFRLAYKKLKETHDSQPSSLLKTLFIIGGAAVAAKWLLTKMIEDKMRGIQRNNQMHQNDLQRPTKIVLVKTAEEALTAKQLATASFLKEALGK